MEVKKLTEVAPGPTPHQVDARKLYDSEHAQIICLTLKPGEKLLPHITPVDAVFYVLKGEGVVEIGDEKETVGVDTLIDSPARIPHCWYNESDEILQIMVIKLPRPTEPTKLL